MAPPRTSTKMIRCHAQSPYEAEVLNAASQLNFAGKKPVNNWGGDESLDSLSLWLELSIIHEI